MHKVLFLFVIITCLSAQGFEVSGRTTIINQYIDYNKNTRFGNDSLSNYSKNNLFAGNNQIINLSLFGRKNELEFQLQSDIAVHQDWKKINFNDLERITFFIGTNDFQLNIGDFYEYRSEEFLANREVRGAKFSYNVSNKNQSVLKFTALYGQIERQRKIGEKIYNQYKTVETVGKYQRKAFAFYSDIYAIENMLVNLNFLTGSDSEEYGIGASENPLRNMTYGGNLRYKFLNNAMSLYGQFMMSATDTLYENADGGEKIKDHYLKSGFNYFHRYFNADISYFQIKPKFYSFGNPFLETDKQGFQVKSAVRFTNEYYLDMSYSGYENNLGNDSSFTTKTKYITAEFGTMFSSNFNIAAGLTLQIDDSDIINNELIDKTSNTYELRTSYDMEEGRLSLSYSHTDFNDKSIFSSGNAISSKQDILNFAYYYSNGYKFESSGGLVYSNYSADDNSSTKSYFLYTSNKYSLIPEKLRAELSLNLNLSDGSESKSDTFTAVETNSALLSSFLNRFNRLDGYVAAEYFFNYNVSLKLSYGVDHKEFDYIKDYKSPEIQSLLNSVGNQSFFDKNESYYAKKMNFELNILF